MYSYSYVFVFRTQWHIVLHFQHCHYTRTLLSCIVFVLLYFTYNTVQYYIQYTGYNVIYTEDFLCRSIYYCTSILPIVHHIQLTVHKFIHTGTIVVMGLCVLYLHRQILHYYFYLAHCFVIEQYSYIVYSRYVLKYIFPDLLEKG